MKKKFIQFLKDNNALIPLICEIARQNKGITFSQYYNHIIETTEPKLLITYQRGFTKLPGILWNETTEGFTHWEKLYIKWKSVYNQP